MNSEGLLYQHQFDELSCCVIIPTYNNATTIASVLKDVLSYTRNVVVINDGSTDATADILKLFTGLEVLEHHPNKGKGMALRNGLKYAYEKGYRYAISIDSDGQHYANDLPVFLKNIEEHPDALLIGARNLNEENMPKKNTFGNKFSNFWFRLETGINLPDTQSGYRLYPLHKMGKMHFFSRKYEFEIEVMVRSAWRNIKVIPVPIKVFYAEEGKRVSHFRPFMDFFRISVLNTCLVIPALLWYRPKQLIKHLHPKYIRAFLIKHFMESGETVNKKSQAVAFGIFMGIIPIWGYQLVSALLLAHLLKLNKAIVGLAANISVPPMIPFLLYGSFKTGELVLNKPVKFNIFRSHLTLDSIKNDLLTYIVGSIFFAVIMALVFGIGTFIILKMLNKKNLQKPNNPINNKN